MAHFALRDFDRLNWHAMSGYSMDVARSLERAYRHLARARQAPLYYEYAFAAVAPYFSAAMNIHQRMRVCYVAAMALTAVDDHRAACGWLDQAIDLASDAAAPDALLDLLFARSKVCRAMLRLAQASADSHACLELLRAGAGERQAPTAGFKMQVLVALAGFEFHLGHYEATEHLLDQAREQQNRLPTPAAADNTHDHELLGATLAWTEALIWRWRGQPERALILASEATRIYGQWGDTPSSARAELLVSEVALDLAGHLRVGSDHDALVDLARPHVASAAALAHDAHDVAAQGLTQLARVRLDRERGVASDRKRMLDDVIRSAERLDDVALLAHAFTSLADEVLYEGRTEAARQLYGEVLSALEDTDVPALAVWARRGLHRLQMEAQDSTG